MGLLDYTIFDLLFLIYGDDGHVFSKTPVLQPVAPTLIKRIIDHFL